MTLWMGGLERDPDGHTEIWWLVPRFSVFCVSPGPAFAE